MTSILEAVRQVLTLYPQIYFACHTRHVRDPDSQRLLSRHQASVLDHLDELDPTTVNDLARHMGVTPATMSLAIDRLERKGYVARARDGADRRRVHVRLTSAGVRIREASSVLDPSRVEALLARLTEGIEDCGDRLKAERVRILSANNSHSVIELELGEGKNREVRRMLAAVDLVITRLQRIQIGPIKLGELRPGKWRTLTEPEIKSLLSPL